MHKALAFLALLLTGSAAHAQVDLTAYADANGYIDVQRLTCAQLAGTWQGDADSPLQEPTTREEDHPK